MLFERKLYGNDGEGLLDFLLPVRVHHVHGVVFHTLMSENDEVQ